MGWLIGIIFCSLMVIGGVIAIASGEGLEVLLLWGLFVFLDVFFIAKFVKRKKKTKKDVSKSEDKTVDDTALRCSICGAPNISKRLVDGVICRDCVEKSKMMSLNWKKESVAKVKSCIKEAETCEERKQLFVPEKTIDKLLLIDYSHKMWKTQNYDTVFEFGDIVDYEILEDGNSVTKGGLGRAIVGGAAFGGVGAIVGGVTGAKITKQSLNELGVKIVTRNPRFPSVYIKILQNKATQGSLIYNDAQEKLRKILTELVLMKDALEQGQKYSSDADDLMKYKELLDKGVLTQEEFDAKKKQILGLQ